MTDRTLTVACVLRSGGGYDAEWVRRLKNGVERHLTLPHRFVALSDVDAPCDRVVMRRAWRGWWSKLEMFEHFKGPTLYFDLDTVIVGSLDAIADHRHTFTAVHEYYRPNMLCSTAMAWNGDYSFIADAYADSPHGIAHKYDHQIKPRIGDQAFIEDQLAIHGVRFDTFRDLFGERSIASYKVHRCEDAPPEDAAAVAFHGRPKPSELKTGWVPKAWR